MAGTPAYQRLFAELKRRRVFKVAAVYGAVAFVVLQVADIMVPALVLPEALTRAVALILILGFPIALVLAWAFELTPEGLVKTANADMTKSITPQTGQRINKLIISGLTLAVLFLLIERFYQVDEESGIIIPEARADKTSIAVLPFVNMSDDPG